MIKAIVKAVSAAVLAATISVAPGHAASMHQACTGILTQESGEFYALKPDLGQGFWCDADIDLKLAQRVLRTCPVGSRCHIVGSFEGHGTFIWTTLDSVSRRK
jgi:hypothetical protein